MICAFTKKFGSTAANQIQSIIPDIAAHLRRHCNQNASNLEFIETIIGAYISMISCSDLETQKEIISEDFIQSSLDLCIQLCAQIRSENDLTPSGGLTDENDTETNDDTIDDPEDGALENLFGTESMSQSDSSFKRIKIIKKVLGQICHHYCIGSLSTSQIKLISRIGCDIEKIQSLDVMSGLRSNSSLTTIKSLCMSILFPSIVNLTSDEFKSIISDIQTDFSSEFSLILLSRYVYHSVQEWVVKLKLS